MMLSISPIDGRYHEKTKKLSPYFSEYALIKYRVLIEVEYLKALTKLNLIALNGLDQHFQALDQVVANFDEVEAKKIKDIEKITNHDVKAVEYYLREKLTALGLTRYIEFIHFGLTSQDINNMAMPLILKQANEKVIFPFIEETITAIKTFADMYAQVSMLAHTHGQAASPTTFKKEMYVFIDRLNTQFEALSSKVYVSKFGGASGNFNAHKLTFPGIDWPAFGDAFAADLGLQRLKITTQIAHYDQEAAFFQNHIRINNILLDFCKDIWTYISMNYIKQKAVKDEVGSSAMPHKVNPIDFENAEGNLAIANALFSFLAEKLPISRLQRDLTDSTVMRNIGVPYAHLIIALSSIIKGLGKLDVNITKIKKELDDNFAVISEGIQSILKREGVAHPYELLRQFTRGNNEMTAKDFEKFIETLPVSNTVKVELLALHPENYTGYAF